MSETPSGRCHLGSRFQFPLGLGQTPAGVWPTLVLGVDTECSWGQGPTCFLRPAAGGQEMLARGLCGRVRPREAPSAGDPLASCPQGMGSS